MEARPRYLKLQRVHDYRTRIHVEGGEGMSVYAMDFKASMDHDRPACEAWAAIWNDGGRKIAIAAPTLEQLQLAWLRITNLDLIVDRAQHVFFVRAS